MTHRVRPCDFSHGRTRIPRQKREGDVVTREELEMLDFAVKWAPFGGGDEHILPEFGIFPAVFYRRLQRLLAHTTVDDSVRRRLDELCTTKLAPARPGRKRSYSRVRTARSSTSPAGTR
jgi:hypothetical protein